MQLVPTAEDIHRPPVNFLHRYNLLNTTQILNSFPQSGVLLKAELVSLFEHQEGNLPQCWLDVIAGYGKPRSKVIDLAEFRKDVLQSQCHQQRFSKLRCRGFSYTVEIGIDFSDPLSSRVNFRLALMAGKSLFYPARIRRYLRRVGSNHCVLDGFPSICFALGKVTGRECYIFVLQSDLAIRGPSYIRDHFRGWRRVLFSNVIKVVQGTVEAIYLFRAEDVSRACHKSFPLRGNTPDVWRSIYDVTAQDFGMERVTLPRLVNLQIYPNHSRVICRTAYVLHLATVKDVPGLEKEVNL